MQEHDALAAMVASLTADQLAAAKLTQTFSDTTMSPGESNGGNGTFPAVKVDLAVSALNATQKQLVLKAMKPWVRKMDDTVAANLLTIYQGELDATFIAFTGIGVAGDASSFLNANTNYGRIDGPSVWIEFACQNSVVFRNQIHYHTVWRDHVRDYGKDLSLTTPLDSSSASGTVTATSSASYVAGALAPDAIGTLFGIGMVSSTVTASTDPLPTTLGGVQVQFKDAAGVTRNAVLCVSDADLVSESHWNERRRRNTFEKPRTLDSMPGSPTMREPLGRAREISLSPSPRGSMSSARRKPAALRTNPADWRAEGAATMVSEPE